jgi:4-diphosphocytidyl-2-C-methyl-D-erythritol kinase
VLRALDALAPNALGHRLAELAAPLGADVPFMSIDSPMALAWGRGERLLPLPVLTPRPVAVLVPPFPIATRDAYGWLAGSRGAYEPEARVIAPEALATWEGVSGIASNDFDDALRPRFAKIGQLIEHLESAGADIAMLSGSGSAVFGVFPGERDLASLGSPAGARLIVTRTSDRVVRVDANR